MEIGEEIFSVIEPGRVGSININKPRDSWPNVFFFHLDVDIDSISGRWNPIRGGHNAPGIRQPIDYDNTSQESLPTHETSSPMSVGMTGVGERIGHPCAIRWIRYNHEFWMRQ